MRVSTWHDDVLVEEDVEPVYFAEFPRTESGDCVFCKGDPCGERSDKTSIIWKHMHNPDGTWSGQSTCPVCDGRPT